MLQQRQKKKRHTHIHAWYINTDYRNKHIHTYAHTNNKHAYKYTDYYHNTCFNVVKWIKLCYFPSLKLLNILMTINNIPTPLRNIKIQ